MMYLHIFLLCSFFISTHNYVSPFSFPPVYSYLLSVKGNHILLFRQRGCKDTTSWPQILYTIYESSRDTSIGWDISDLSDSRRINVSPTIFTFNILLFGSQIWRHCNHKFITGEKSVFLWQTLVIYWYCGEYPSSWTIMGIGGGVYPYKLHRFWLPCCVHQSFLQDFSNIYSNIWSWALQKYSFWKCNNYNKVLILRPYMEYLPYKLCDLPWPLLVGEKFPRGSWCICGQNYTNLVFISKVCCRYTPPCTLLN